jgi:hypothetical protein
MDGSRGALVRAAVLPGTGLLLLAATVAWLGPAAAAQYERILENSAGWGPGMSPGTYETRGAPPPRSGPAGEAAP